MKYDLVKKISDEQGSHFGSIMNAIVTVNLKLDDFTHGSDILSCLKNNEVFGLSNNSNSVIVFDPGNLRIYDYTFGKLTLVQSRNSIDFLNFIKLSIINHRDFLTEEKCIGIFEPSGLLEM